MEIEIYINRNCQGKFDPVLLARGNPTTAQGVKSLATRAGNAASAFFSYSPNYQTRIVVDGENMSANDLINHPKYIGFLEYVS